MIAACEGSYFGLHANDIEKPNSLEAGGTSRERQSVWKKKTSRKHHLTCQVGGRGDVTVIQYSENLIAHQEIKAKSRDFGRIIWKTMKRHMICVRNRNY